MIEALLGECVGPLGRLGLEPAGALCMQELSDKGHTSPGQLVGQLGCCFRGGGGGVPGGLPASLQGRGHLQSGQPGDNFLKAFDTPKALLK